MSTTQKVDVVIPLGNGSKFDNLELRLALRSIAINLPNINQIWIMTEYAPTWLINVNVVKSPDLYTNNKDANLFTKVLQACDTSDVAEHFLFWSDDQAILKPVNLNKWPVVINSRGPDKFTNNSTWPKRMQNTFKYLANKGHNLTYNFDSHVPQMFSKTLFKSLIEKTPFKILPGFCINTLYFGLQDGLKVVEQTKYKSCFEGKQINPVLGNTYFAGYNDQAFISGVREILLAKFPNPCKYEKSN